MTGVKTAPAANGKANEATTLLSALLAFQAECPTLPKDATNPHFRSKFTPLDTIVERVGPLLVKHGLTWSTFPCHDEHGPALRYVLGHAASGETLEGTMPLLLTKSDPQGQGSAITYARRYSICAVLNLVGDEDDDGNAGSRGQQGANDRAPSRPVTARPAEPTRRLATGKQKGLVNARAEEHNLTALELLNILRAAGGSDGPLTLEPDEAQAKLRKALDRLPADLVDPVLEAIKAHDPETEAIPF